MSSVDNRIVNMGFNGSQFFSGVMQAIGLLGQLQNSLKLTEATQGMDKLSAAANKIDVSGLQSSVDGIASRFSTLGVIGMSALNNLTSRAINAGAQMVKALTVAPVMTGFNEMELKMKSIQTILSNTQSRYGTNVGDVTRALDELNTYADKTIYNFAEMTQNIGRFTTAGLDLDTSITGIKGLANLGAFFNAGSTNVTRAMYQMSQAMAAGSVKLMDWNSLVNANMGGTEFVDDIMRVARKHGVAIDEMIADQGSFRETLREGWLTNDIFLESLSHFSTDVDAIGEDVYRAQLAAEGWSDAEIDKIVYLGRTATEAATKVRSWTQLWDTLSEEAGSSWATTWETIFGNFEDSTELFNGAYKMLNPFISGMGQWRNDLLGGWAQLGGRDSLIRTVTTLGEDLLGTLSIIGDAASDAFDISPQGLVNMTTDLEKFVSSLQLSEDAVNDAKATFEGFFSLFDIAGQVGGFLLGVGGEVVKALFPLTDGLLDITGFFGGGITGFSKWLDESNLLDDALANIHGFLTPIRDLMSDVSAGIGDFVDFSASKLQELQPVFDAVFGGMGDAMGGFQEWLDGVRGSWSDVLDNFGRNLQNGIPGFGEGVDGFVQGLVDMVTPNPETMDDVEQKKTMLGRFGETIGTFVTDFAKGVQDFFRGTSEINIGTVSADAGSVLGNVVEMFTSIPWADVLAVVGIFGTAKVFANMASTFTAASRAFKGVFRIVDDFGDLVQSFKKIGNATALYIKLQGLAAFVEALAPVIAAIAALAFVEGMAPGSAGRAIEALQSILWQFAGLVAVVSALGSKVKVGSVMGLAQTLVTFAIAMMVIAGAVMLLADIPQANLDAGVGAMVTLMRMLGTMTVLMSSTGSFTGKHSSLNLNSGRVRGQILQIIAIVGAVMALANVVQQLGSMNPDAVATGLDAVTRIMTSVTAALTALSMAAGLSFNSDMFGVSYKGGTATPLRNILALIAVMESVKMLSDVVRSLGSMNPDGVAQGLAAMSTILNAVIAAMAAVSALAGMSYSSDTFGVSYKGGKATPLRNILALIAIAGSVKALADVVGDLGGMDAGAVAQGIQGMGQVLLALVGAMGAMALISKTMGAVKIRNIATIIVLVSAMKGLADVVHQLGSMYGANMGNGIAGLQALAGILEALMAVMTIISNFSGGFTSSLGTILLMTTSVNALVKLVDVVRQLSDVGLAGIGTGAVGIFAVLTALAGGLALLNAAGRNAPVAGLMAYAATLGLLAAAFKSFADLSFEQTAQGIVAMAGALAVIGISAALLSGSALAIAELGGALLIFNTAALIGAAAVWVLAEAFTVLGNITGPALAALLENLPKVAVAIVNAFLDAVQALASRAAEFGTAIGQILLGALQGLLGIAEELTATLAQLLIDVFNGIGEYAPQLVDALINMLCNIFDAVARNADRFMGSLKNLTDAIAQAFGKSFGEIQFDQSTVDGIVKSMYEIFALIALMKFSGVGIKDALKTVAELGLVFGAMVGLYALISLCASDEANEALGKINESVAIITAVCVAFSVIPWQGAVNAIVGLDLFIANLTAILAALGALKQIPGFEWLISEGGQLLGTLGEAIGRFIGGIGQGMVEQFSGSFGEVGRNLSDFATNAGPFFEFVGSLDPSINEKLTSFKEVVDVIGKLGTKTTNGYNDFSSQKLKQLGEFLPQLATMMSDFQTNLGDVDPAALTSVGTLLESIGGLVEKMPKKLSGTTDSYGVMSLSEFATDLSGFATEVKSVIDTIGPADSFDTSGVEAIIGLARELNGLQQELPPINNGSSAWWTGSTQTLNSFATGIADLGESIQGLIELYPTAEGLDLSGVRAIAELAKEFIQMQIDLASGTTMDTSWFSWEQFMGIGEFGNQLGIFADHLKGKDLSFKEFGQESGFDMGRVRNMLTVVSALAEIQGELAQATQTESGWTGGTDFTTIGGLVEQIAAHSEDFQKLSDISIDEETAAGVGRLGTALSALATAFSTDMADYNPVNVNNLVNNLNSLSQIFSGNGLNGSVMGGIDFATVSSNIQQISTVLPGLIGAFSSLSTATGENGETMGGSIQGFLDSLDRLFQYDFGAILTNIDTSVQGIQNSIGNMLTQMSNDLTTKTEEFRTAGENMGKALIEGMNAAGTDTSALTALVQAALDAIASKEGDFKTKGETSGQNYVDGVSSKQGPAADAARQMASEAASAAEGGYDAFYSAGANAAQGYVDGIEAKIGEARTKAAELASVAAAATNAAQQSHSPSRVFMKIGANAAMGYILGMRDQQGAVKSEAGSMVAGALAKAYDLAQREKNFQPVIAPVYDGSSIEEGVATSEMLLKGLQTRALSHAIGLSDSISTAMRPEERDEAESEGTGATQIVQNFTQNNTSPKALSRLDIYRDTRNLFALAKEAAVK